MFESSNKNIRMEKELEKVLLKELESIESHELNGWIYKLFNHLADFFRSMAAIIFFLLLLTGFQMFETQTFFFDLLVSMNGYKRIIASCFVASAIEFTQLLFTVNKDKFNHNAPLYMGISSLFINLAYFEFWKDERGIEINHQNVNYFTIGMKCFVSALIAYLTYNYSELFIKKWQELKLTLSFKQILLAVKEKRIVIDELITKEDKIKENHDELLYKQENLMKDIIRKEEEIDTIKTSIDILDEEIDEKKHILDKSRLSIDENLQKLTELEEQLETLSTLNKTLNDFAKKFQCSKCGKFLSDKRRKIEHENSCKEITKPNNLLADKK